MIISAALRKTISAEDIVLQASENELVTTTTVLANRKTAVKNNAKDIRELRQRIRENAHWQEVSPNAEKKLEAKIVGAKLQHQLTQKEGDKKRDLQGMQALQKRLEDMQARTSNMLAKIDQAKTKINVN